jgi:hypothetical protein
MKVLTKAMLGAAVGLALAVGLTPIASAQQGTTNNPKGEPATAPIEQNNNSAATDSGTGSHLHIGYLSCHVASGWGYILGGSQNLRCIYSPLNGTPQLYTGRITKVGADIGYLKSAVMLWGVLAPSSDVPKGALSGNYAGVTANAAVGYGAGVSAVIGGFKHSIELEPITISGEKGLNVAAGIEDLSLHYRGPERMQRAAR